MRLISTAIEGNCHEAVIVINKLNLARFVLCMECNEAIYTNVVLRTEGPAEWDHVRKVLHLVDKPYEVAE